MYIQNLNLPLDIKFFKLGSFRITKITLKQIMIFKEVLMFPKIFRMKNYQLFICLYFFIGFVGRPLVVGPRTPMFHEPGAEVRTGQRRVGQSDQGATGGLSVPG